MSRAAAVALAMDPLLHSPPKFKAWLAARPRWNLRLIPSYGSWCRQVRRFFSPVPDKAIRRRRLDP